MDNLTIDDLSKKMKHIRNLFERTEDGVLPIIYYPDNGEADFELTYKVDWDKEVAKNIENEYSALITMLTKFGQMHYELKDPKKRKELLTAEELSVWETYILPFEPFEVPESVVGELYLRCEYDELSEEEDQLLERHHDWREICSLKRLPFNRCSPSNLILRAQRYEKLCSMNAPEIVINEEARCLAEEMVLYYCLKN